MKTVIGGASIIDLMILVVDCQKLIQTQTAECIVLGELLMDKLIVAFNKTDLLRSDPPKLAAQLKKLQM
jgi:selenocysteine-specific elongation factor